MGEAFGRALFVRLKPGNWEPIASEIRFRQISMEGLTLRVILHFCERVVPVIEAPELGLL